MGCPRREGDGHQRRGGEEGGRKTRTPTKRWWWYEVKKGPSHQDLVVLSVSEPTRGPGGPQSLHAGTSSCLFNASFDQFVKTNTTTLPFVLVSLSKSDSPT
jgi:hypothetical protein